MGKIGWKEPGTTKPFVSEYMGMEAKVKGPLTIRSSRGRFWGCGAHLALLAEGAGVQLLGHVASMTKQLLANQSSARKRHLPSRRSGTYLSTCTLTCFRTARLAGAGTEQRELTLSQGFEPPTFCSTSPRLCGLTHSATCCSSTHNNKILFVSHPPRPRPGSERLTS